ncbi:MAG: glycine cleavage system aminomethyltransferase GcvT, partial [Deltaproteobacteria bacterium]|nr:glycine cleavage system aminomethyltransferase GcvT [Deltaproteobacteria bacterium]
PLYGHELDENTTPLEARLAWVVKLDKGEFIGRQPLLRQKTDGVKRKLVGLEVVGSGIPRSGYALEKQNRSLGAVTSGTLSPTLRKPIAMGYVPSEEARVDNTLEIDIRGRKVAAKIIPLPFYRRSPRP